MTPRPRPTLFLLAGLGTLALAVPAGGLAAEKGATGVPPTEVTSTPAPAATPPPATPTTAVPSPAPSSTTAVPPPAPTGSGAPAVATAPRVQAQHAQRKTRGSSGAGGHPNARSKGNPVAGATESPGAPAGVRAGGHAPSPLGLTPALPLALSASLAGEPSFFIESFRVPPFLLPIYQAAGTAYGIPWQVLAAINEVETDYGRDLSVSSAGAEGWMQFLPAEWAQYGVDANGDGFKDPYNPADAIFAAARYLRAAGGGAHIRAAVYAYNHSRAYVDSVMLRAQLLGGTPTGLLGAITGLTQARFPVHAASHFSDGFPTAPARGSSPPRTLVGTTIYSQAGAPVTAVQDGEIVQIGDSPSLGRFVSLRDAFGNTYVYGELGAVATLYPVLGQAKTAPLGHAGGGARTAQGVGGAVEPPPSGPATAGVHPGSPLSEGASGSGLTLGAAGLGPAPSAAPPPQAVPPPPSPPAATVRAFREGSNEVYLHPLRAGVEVVAGTVLGHVGSDQPHMLFQIRPAGAGAPLIDPKPILDGWVALENSSTFRAKGGHPFLQSSPTVGQVLLESKRQLERQVQHDSGIHLRECERQDIQSGRVDRRVLAALEFLLRSGLKPRMHEGRCGSARPSEGNAQSAPGGEEADITAINGIPIAGHQGPGSIADITVRKLLTLQGAFRPRQIISLMSYPGAAGAVARRSARDEVRVIFSAPNPSTGHNAARTAGVFDSALTPNEWTRLIARLGEIPDPTVAGGPSAAAIPDQPGAANASGREAGGNH
jgi:hypothetical protein